MQIIWYGHSCFLIKTSNGKRILMDPFDNCLGYSNDFPKCDIITMSHSHSTHSYLNNVNYKTRVINSSGTFDLNYLNITGMKTFHDNCNGLKRGSNMIFLFKFDNISICHLGDLGHIPCNYILDKLKNIDVLFIPIGGHFTLNGHEAYKLCSLIKPKLIIPMHYKTNALKINIDDCKNFLIHIPIIEKINSNLLNVNSSNMNSSMKVMILKPPLI